MIAIDFENLFTIEILHKFFADNVCNDFTVTSSATTDAVAAGHKVIVKQLGNKVFAAAQVDANKKPFVTLEEGMQLTLFMWLNNPLFYNYTNLNVGSGTSTVYYFTNRNVNQTNGKSLLTEKIPGYNSANTYRPGDLAVNGFDVTFRAIRSSNSANQHGLSEADYWADVDDNDYVSNVDVLQWLPSLATYNFSTSQASANITLRGYNAPANDYTKSFIAKTITFPAPVLSFPLDLSGVPSGKYSLTVNGIQQWIYLNDELAGGRPFAVIDIFNQANPPTCNLLDGAGALLSPLYSIYFLNRATIWKYILPLGKTGSINDTASVYHFTGAANQVTSLTPIPLTNKPLNFKVTVNTHAYTPIACANPQRLTSFTQAGDTYPCSEIFLNY